MKRVLLIISLHLFLFLIVFAYQAQAEEDNEWYVNDFGTFVVAAVSGEVVHGDKLRFFIKKEDCSKVSMMFSFSTSLKKDEIKELQDKKLPIRINDWDTIRGARVVYVHPFGFMTIVMMQTPGYHDIKEFIGALNTMYTFEKIFSIQLVKQSDYDPKDHFDILRNHWKLDRLEENIEIAQSMCLGPDEIKKT
tara:strand:- start:64 stop:639 length:576 start_codon:yes stop_codon:yes gene_type:complete